MTRGVWFIVSFFSAWTTFSNVTTVSTEPSSTGFAHILLIVGAPGDPEYDARFREWAQQWITVAEKAKARLSAIGLEQPVQTNSLELIHTILENEPKAGRDEIWIVLLGHGTFDGKEAKFNLVGPDLTASQLSLWLKPFSRPQIVINTTSASSPFMTELSGPERIIITATKSGHEGNFAHFGQYFAAVLTDPTADIDKDGQISLLECFLSAGKKVTEFYETEGRLTTEHALLDDSGDGLGTPVDWFQGVRAVKKAKDGSLPDGLRAQQICLLPSEAEQKLPYEIRARRNELEMAVAHLREKKSTYTEENYYQKLEDLLMELAQLYKPSSPRAE